MNTLARQQRAMQRAIVARQDAGDLLRGLRGESPLLRIYQHAYEVRLAAALRDNFGVLPQVMGDDAFDALARAYVAAHPSRAPSIRWFGDQLASFMAAHEDLVSHPSLVDLARMEWALRASFDAADGTPIDATAFTQIAPERWAGLVFTALPSVQLLHLQWAVEPVWRALQSANEGEEPELPEPARHAHALLIWRQGLDNRWRSLDSAQAGLLQAALDGENFGQLCELAAQQSGPDEAAAVAVAALHSWLADGLLAGVRGSA